MTDTELIIDNSGTIEHLATLTFDTAQKMFQDRDRDGEVTTPMLLLTEIGARAAAIVLCCRDIRALTQTVQLMEADNAAEQNKTA